MEYNSILITGASGFVGSNLILYLENKYKIKKYDKDEDLFINENIVIHAAGKAHDLKKKSNSNEYYEINTNLTKYIFDEFLVSEASVFFYFSSVKAAADSLDCELDEGYLNKPISHYGKSKLLAEKYILSKKIPLGKRVFILRPCMIHGPGNKGNLNLLYSIISKGIPWPLGAFDNKRSFCSIDNLCFIIDELIDNDKIPSGVYNIADNDPVSTNEVIALIAKSQNKNFKIWNVPKSIIIMISKLGDLFRLLINTERLNKLTETYIVSNKKIKEAINKPLPMNAKDGLLKTFDSFNNRNTY
jgi:nucleoside-diphosphate-sugar epimerase